MVLPWNTTGNLPSILPLSSHSRQILPGYFSSKNWGKENLTKSQNLHKFSLLDLRAILKLCLGLVLLSLIMIKLFLTLRVKTSLAMVAYTFNLSRSLSLRPAWVWDQSRFQNRSGYTENACLENQTNQPWVPFPTEQ